MPSGDFARAWDVVIVGSGIGGGVLARSLAERGVSVLILERGTVGHPSEQHGLNAEMTDVGARRTRGYWPTAIPATVNGDMLPLLDTVGAAVGGTSVFYAASLERPERHDLDEQDGRPHPTGGWPVSYEEFAPFYSEAERLFQVSGTRDPLSRDDDGSALRTPPELSPVDSLLAQTFQRSGLHPYQIHVGMKHVPGCIECAGHKCPKKCKMDAKTVGIDPALATGNASLVSGFQVTRLNGARERITSVEGLYEGDAVQVKGRVVVVAAGGLGSPALLLASASSAWPNGCGNGSGLVGRNLMFHMNELIAIWPPRKVAADGPAKALSLRDFYFVDGQRYGTFQSLGVAASYGSIVQFLNDKFDRSIFRRMRLLRECLRIPALVATYLFGPTRIFAGILEDLPYQENRVRLAGADQDSLELDYSFHGELLQRRAQFRKLIAKGMKGARHFFITQSPTLNFGHPCGTLRFGNDPKTSVLDRYCRSHEICNLFVVDSSFMPTSMGVNPSLTIAANALRVSDAVREQVRQEHNQQRAVATVM